MTGAWVEPVAKDRSLLGVSTVSFLGETRDVANARCWNDPSSGKLWLYNLHYFDDLSGSSTPQQRKLQEDFTLRWIAENPPALGCGWDPYPTSLRIVNWIKRGRAESAIPGIEMQSLAVQCRWLAKRVEHHLLANHLFVNGKALVFGGLFFDGPEADQWLDQGLGILKQEIPEQILSDGGHFERSPMYHAIVLEDLLDLINASNAWHGRIPEAIVEGWKDCARAMLDWLSRMVHPDGEFAFFNDCAFAIAPTLAQLRAYATRLGFSSSAPALASINQIGSSGYARAESGSAVLIADVAPIGPEYQPGHAHADTLSFELSIHGCRVLVNSGTSTYAIGSQRAHERSTRAHNTVEIDGCDSSEVWGGFRVARRAHVISSSFEEADGSIVITGAHDGYRRLRGRPVHLREWRLSANRLVIVDSISGRFTTAVARLYLHPSIVQVGPHAVRLPTGEQLLFAVHGGCLNIETASWHPQFGPAQTNLCVVLRMSKSTMTTELQWV